MREPGDRNDDLIGRPANVLGLLDYQRGAIVSRTILDRDTGTVTLFAFDAGEGLSEHTAPFDALLHVLEGAAEVTVSGQQSTVEAGEMFVMPANQPHAVKAGARCKMALVMIRS